MRGKVSQNFEAILPLRIFGPQSIAKVAAVINTGYNGALTLPRSLIRTLGLPRVTSSTATLADGSSIAFDIYAGTVLWHGKKVLIDIDETVGMQLLEGSELKVHVRNAGSVAIRPLP